MKKLFNILVSGIYSLSLFAGLAVMTPQVVHAHEGEEHVEVAQVAPKATTKPTEVTYKYVAQSGDSYTLMARKAIQTYGIKNKVKLSRAKIIAAETWMTQEAASPYLNLSQGVELKEASVKSYVEKAQKLTADQEAAWGAYVSGANFNTSAVGQQ